MRDGKKLKSVAGGVVIPLLGCAFGFYQMCCLRHTKNGMPISDEDAFWMSISIFGLAFFFHAQNFGFYKRHRWLRWLLLTLAVLTIAGSVVLNYGPKLARVLKRG